MIIESERETRKKRIDPLLKAAGWAITSFPEGMDLSKYNKYALEEYPTENGPADYALCVDGKILAVVEAKKVTRGPQGVLTQAERYAEGLNNNPFNFEGRHVPFLYSTNGELIFFHDVRHRLNLSREIAKFHTPNALLEQLNRNNEVACYNLRQKPNDHPGSDPIRLKQISQLRMASIPGNEICSSRWQPVRENLHTGQRNLPADEIRGRKAYPVPC